MGLRPTWPQNPGVVPVFGTAEHYFSGSLAGLFGLCHGEWEGPILTWREVGQKLHYPEGCACACTKGAHPMTTQERSVASWGGGGGTSDDVTEALVGSACLVGGDPVLLPRRLLGIK